MHPIQDSPTGWMKEDGLTGESRGLKNDKAVELLGFYLLVFNHILDRNVGKSTEAMGAHTVHHWSHDWVACCV